MLENFYTLDKFSQKIIAKSVDKTSSNAFLYLVALHCPKDDLKFLAIEKLDNEYLKKIVNNATDLKVFITASEKLKLISKK